LDDVDSLQPRLRVEAVERLACVSEEYLRVVRPPLGGQPLAVLELDDGEVEGKLEGAELSGRGREVAVGARGVAGREFFDLGHLHTETDERTLDGTPMRIEGDYMVIYDAQGRIAGHFGIQRDITDQHLASEQIETSRQQLRALASRLQKVREEERTFIAREIHDELGQALTGLKPDIAWMKHRLPRDHEVMDQCESIIERIDYILEECPMAKGAKSLEYKALLNTLEETQPGAKYEFLVGFLKQGRAALGAQPVRVQLGECAVCGQPSTAAVCAHCRMAERGRRKAESRAVKYGAS